MRIDNIISCNINLLMNLHIQDRTSVGASVGSFQLPEDPSEDPRARDRRFIRAIMVEVYRQKIGIQDLSKACQDSIQMLQEEMVDLGVAEIDQNPSVPQELSEERNCLLVIRTRIWILEMLDSALLKKEFPSLSSELVPIINHDTEWSRILPLFLTDLIQNPTPFLLQQSLFQCSCIDRGLAKLYPTCLSFAEMIHDTLLT